MRLNEIIKEFENCPCGHEHTTGIKAIEIGKGIVKDVGKILKANGFAQRFLLVCDSNTLKAADGIEESLKNEGFEAVFHKYPGSLRTAEMREVEKIQSRLKDVGGVLSVGTGSLNDICRLAAARENKPFAIFATAASMDGFASDSAPITEGSFKITYPAKAPEIIIADTCILAAAPDFLKSAGFGDMAGKYIALIDWQVSAVLSGEYYCGRVAALTRKAADRIAQLAPKIRSKDPDSAKEVFEALLLTGIGMSFTKTSRPASGTEHILSHFWECKKLLNNEISDYHGNKVGVATLLILKEYERLACLEKVSAHKPVVDWEAVYKAYGILSAEVKKYNDPPVTDSVEPLNVEKNWRKICEIVRSVPSYTQIYEMMKTAGCPVDCNEIGVGQQLKEQGLKFHPYMRGRMSLYRLKPFIEPY